MTSKFDFHSRWLGGVVTAEIEDDEEGFDAVGLWLGRIDLTPHLCQMSRYRVEDEAVEAYAAHLRTALEPA
jgi:hypothetical protein